MDKIIVIDTCAFIHVMYINCFYLLDSLKYSCLTTKFIQLEIDSGLKETKECFYSMLKNKKINFIQLQVEDLIEIAKFSETRRVSNSELSCFTLTKRYGYRTMTDDEPAIKFAINNLDINPKEIIRLLNLLLEAYDNNFIGDGELKDFQEVLEKRNFVFHIDILEEAARRKYLSKKDSLK